MCPPETLKKRFITRSQGLICRSISDFNAKAICTKSHQISQCGSGESCEPIFLNIYLPGDMRRYAKFSITDQVHGSNTFNNGQSRFIECLSHFLAHISEFLRNAIAIKSDKFAKFVCYGGGNVL